MSQIAWLNFLKIGHISKYFPTKSKAPNFEFNKGKEKVDVSTSKERWIEHGREDMEVAHLMEGSLHPKGQLVTLHPTKQKEDVWDWYLMPYHTLVCKMSEHCKR